MTTKPRSIVNDLSLSAVGAGFIAVLVGFASSLAIVLQATEALQLSQALIETWIFALGIGMGICCLSLSWWYKRPIIIAWSTPGAALLAVSLVNVGVAEATGIFIAVALMSFALALTGTFTKVAKAIPMPIAAALLAGVLVQFGLSIFTSFSSEPWLVGIMLLSFFVCKRLIPRYAVITVLIIGAVSAYLLPVGLSFDALEIAMVQPIFTFPEFSFTSIVGIGIPLFIVTMSAQNLPGIAVLKASGYPEQPISPIIGSVNIVTTVLAPLGCFALNLAAITAAICTGGEANEDKNKRYIAGIFAGIFNLLAGLMAVSVVSVFAGFPAAFISTLAGLALLSTISSSLHTALNDSNSRDAAMVTFLVCASGMQFFSISGAFWGVVLGISVYLLQNRNV